MQLAANSRHHFFTQRDALGLRHRKEFEQVHRVRAKVARLFLEVELALFDLVAGRRADALRAARDREIELALARLEAGADALDEITRLCRRDHRPRDEALGEMMKLAGALIVIAHEQLGGFKAALRFITEARRNLRLKVERQQVGFAPG